MAGREVSAPITLPFPPAVNNLFATYGGHRIRSRRYEAWLKEAGTLLALQRPKPVSGPFLATLVFTRPDRRKRDLDGLAKAPLDLLVKHGVIRDDSDAVSLRLSWSESLPNPKAGVSLVLEAA